MGTFSLPLTNKPQGPGFQLGAGGGFQNAGPLPVPDMSGLAQALGQGGGSAGLDIGTILGILQSLEGPPATGGSRFAGDLGLTGPSQGSTPPSPAPSDRRPPPRSRSGSSRSSPAPEFPSSGSPTSVFQSPLRGGTLSRAQEIANLVGGTVGTQGNTRGPADTDPDLFDRVNTVITINGKPFSFNQLEIALQNRGTAGLANTLALEGGITNQFTNDNATAGSSGRF